MTMPASKQNQYRSKKWGLLNFIPAKGDVCKKCLLYNELNECVNAPCTTAEREDGKTGYYSVHNLPLS